MIRHLLVVVAVSLLLGCADAGPPQAAAEDATRKFHELLRQERYRDVYLSADPDLQHTYTEVEFVKYLRAAGAQLADAVAANETHVGVVLRRDEAKVVVVYEIRLRDRTISEELWWRVRRQETTLLDYHLDSIPVQ